MHKQIIMRVHTLFYFLCDISSIDDDWKTILTHWIHVLLDLFVLLMRYVTIDCWWCHKCIMWHESCDTRMWKTISNLLDIGFNYAHIHRWSCKKFVLPLISQRWDYESSWNPSLWKQYHCCWWPGNRRSLGISSHGLVPWNIPASTAEALSCNLTWYLCTSIK